MTENKIFMIDKGKSKEFLELLKAQKEKNKDQLEKFKRISEHIKK
jgi:murein L,D-transpeptidase YafK